MKNGWMPIETAPNYVSIMIYRDDGAIDLIDQDDNDFEWSPYDGVRLNYCSKPTHWQPLPKGPHE